MRYALLLLSLLLFACHNEPTPPNILFIAIDDLRPTLGCYGDSISQSPHIDALAQQAFLFRHHYVTVPTCGASRNSLLTGQLPRQPLDLRNDVMLRQLARQPEPEAPETFVHHLRRNGYYTVGLGKISHTPDGHAYDQKDPYTDSLELPHSWDEMLLDAGKWQDAWGAFFAYADGTDRNRRKGQVKPYEAADVPDEGYPDGLTANLALQKLGELKDKKQPFFLGVGFFKPHLPFNAPQHYWDLYERDPFRAPNPNAGLPEGVHQASLHGSGEFNNYQLGEEQAGLDHDLSPEYAAQLRHAYYACVSYTDAQVGKVLAELERLGLAKNTIVVLWSDHGWQLGDHRIWGKHTLFELALQSPLLIKLPGQEKLARPVEQVVSSVDLYPTLMELCGVAMPPETDGHSMVPLMLQTGEPEWENAAYSYFRQGISLRTRFYRFTRYFRTETPNVELYDHRTHPLEQKNEAPAQALLVRDFLPFLPENTFGWPEVGPSVVPLSDGFDFPVGPPNGRGYYNAQAFQANHHLGDDWNGVGGGNSDLGDPVYALANGWVQDARDEGEGWGNVIRIVHQLADGQQVESLYAHLDAMQVQGGDLVRRGQAIGTIGDAHGAYPAHLHLEIREEPNLPLGGGYDPEPVGFMDPTAFIRSHRPH